MEADIVQNSKTPSPSQLDETVEGVDSTVQDVAVRSAFRTKIQERAWYIRGYTDPLGALRAYKNRIRDVLLLSLKKNPQKFYIAVKVNFIKIDKDGYKTEDQAFFHGAMHTVLRGEDFEEAFQTSLKKIWNSFDV